MPELGLVPAPKGWRERADAEMAGWQERLAARHRPRHLVAVDELDWVDDYSGEQLAGEL